MFGKTQQQSPSRSDPYLYNLALYFSCPGRKTRDRPCCAKMTWHHGVKCRTNVLCGRKGAMLNFLRLRNYLHSGAGDTVFPILRFQGLQLLKSLTRIYSSSCSCPNFVKIPGRPGQHLACGVFVALLTSVKFGSRVGIRRHRYTLLPYEDEVIS